MKKSILRPSVRWFEKVFTDTTDPTPPQDNVPPPVPEFGTEPPINTDFDRAAVFNI
jgi:hypothetical protein